MGTPPPRQKSGGGRRRADRVNKSGLAYITINNGAWVPRGHYLRLEHHHLMIQTHPTYLWTGKQQQHQQALRILQDHQAPH